MTRNEIVEALEEFVKLASHFSTLGDAELLVMFIRERTKVNNAIDVLKQADIHESATVVNGTIREHQITPITEYQPSGPEKFHCLLEVECSGVISSHADIYRGKSATLLILPDNPKPSGGE